MLKKVFGIIFILISLIFCIGFLLQLPKILNEFYSDNFGYLVGYAIGSFLFLIIAFIFFQLGLRLIKNTPKKTDSINLIGKNNNL
ncbi:hypothetical protein [Polaribacter sp.]|uniref:hypothetical protein n=1 Tax=Polaribacter sp. TaxID=1920175 RepID=UPI002F35D143